MLKKIKAIILQKQNGGSSTNSMDALSLMMGIEGKEKLEIEEAKDVALELMFAGHETTSSAASTLVLNIARNPDVLFKITEELATNGLLDDRTCDLDLGRINKLKYVRNVVKEALRISPPIGGGYRKALETFEVEVSVLHSKKIIALQNKYFRLERNCSWFKHIRYYDIFLRFDFISGVPNSKGMEYCIQHSGFSRDEPCC